MSKHHRRKRNIRHGIPGRPPGTITTSEDAVSTLHVIAYGEAQAQKFELKSMAQAKKLTEKNNVVWIDITGVNDGKRLQELEQMFGVHPLSLEDVSNVNQRAKFEKFDDYAYFVTRMVSDPEDLQSEQLSIFHTGKFVITFQEVTGDCLKPLRKRILEGAGFIRNRASDYLVYALIDTVLDHYFPVVDGLGERLDELDEQLMASDRRFDAAQVHHIRSELLDLGRWLRPHREMINQLLRDEASSMSAETQMFMRDCYDHVIRLSEAIDTYREICSDLRAYHLSVVSNRTNDVMKTLTIISSIFIPLGFLAGLYGMNFEFMPELHLKYGYFLVLGLMISIAGGLLIWFRSRGWFDD